MAYSGKTQFAQSVPSAQPGFLNSTYHEQGVVGNVFYVSSVTGNASGPGWTPETAFTTIALALAQCVDHNNDKIVVLPSHNEGIGNAQLTWNKAGVWIEGRGRGASVPRIDFDHANASIDITASGMRVSNLQLLPSVTAVLIAIDIATGVTDTVLENIRSLPGEDGAGVDEFAKTIDIKAGCDRTLIRDCDFTQHASAAGVLSNVCLTGASDLVEIRDCRMWAAGAGLVAPINGDTTLSTRLLIENCVLVTDAEPGIEVLTGTTGVIRDVDIFGDLGTIDAATVADGMAHFDVKYCEVGDEAGTLVKTESADD